MHLKVFMKLEKTLKTLSSGQKNPKNPKNPQKNPKKTKKPKKPKKNKKKTKNHRAGLKKNRVFSNPARIRIRNTLIKDVSLCISVFVGAGGGEQPGLTLSHHLQAQVGPDQGPASLVSLLLQLCFLFIVFVFQVGPDQGPAS